MKLVVGFNNAFELEFDVLTEHRIARRWARKLKAAQRLGYPIDDPKRFYSFNSEAKEISHALELINRDVDIINSYSPVIDRQLTDIHDQDTLNYLHNIFEVYHGHLQTQDHEFWLDAPADVQQALADLNIHVHRCEAIGRGANPRFVITWFGLPKKHIYDPSDYELFTNQYEFGTVYINYVEIGKSLEHYYTDRELDNHAYASADAFKPFTYFSADLVAMFYDVSKQDADDMQANCKEYFKQHREFFERKGYSINDECLKPGRLPVARLNSSLSKQEILDKIKDNQLVTGVYFK